MTIKENRMKFIKNQRGFVFIEFVIALPLLILLLYALGTLTLTTAKIAREQVQDYVLETEAQEIIDRITEDARAAETIEIKYSNGMTDRFENIFFMCNSITQIKEIIQIEGEDVRYIRRVLDPRIYAVHSPNSGLYHVYFKRQNDNYFTSPIIGENSYGNTYVTQMKFSVPAPKVLHITFEMQTQKRNQKVKFSTAVYMPGCKKINDKGTIYNYE